MIPAPWLSPKLKEPATIDETAVATFFYGSYMNRAVLREVRLTPEFWQAAKLSGYSLQIAPLANLIVAADSSAFGVLSYLTHDELERLYRHADQVLGALYLPRPVLVEWLTGGFVPALCYLATAMDPAPPAADYVERILTAARELDFPATYLDLIASFRPHE